MNRNCHRIVFNKHRGQLMAVAETALCVGKSAAGESVGNGASTLSSTHRRPASTRLTALGLALSLFGITPQVVAQIIADPNAPANQRPTVLSDSQGRPLVNIQTPSAAGLSRNTYRQFDVPTSGIWLNNSASNPWLANGVLARTILNEVNSTSQSYINGAITVNGAAAQVIVANPNGITINGGGFINASRATLTTGTAQISNGTLTGFNVRGGAVTVGTGGMNNSATPYTDLLSRAVILTGKLQAQNLSITTGLQTVAYDSGLISNQDTNTYAAGALTIDTAALGGMVANNISILATEAGLGVRNQGTWQAAGGQIVVTADGLLQNLGTVQAGVTSLATVKGNIENAGAVQGCQAVVMSAGGDARLFGAGLKQTAGSAVVISAKGAVNLYNNASYGAAQVSSTAAGGQVSISAGQNLNFYSGTSVSADKDVQLSTDATLAASGASITSSAGNVTALAGTGLGLSNSTVTGQQVHLETGAAFKDSAASLVVQGGNVRGQTQTTLLAAGSLLVHGPGATAVSGGGNVHLQANQAVDITAGSSITAGQHMSVMAATGMNLQAISGSTASNGQKVTLAAGGNLLVSGNTVTATGASLSAGQDLSIEANDGNANLHALTNAGGSSVDKLTLSAGKDLNISVFKGSLFATGLQATGQNLALLSNGTTSVANATVRNGSNTQAVASTLTARDDLTIGSINSTAGVSSQVQVVASSLSAGGQARVLSNGVALITAATDTINGVNAPARSSITAGSIAIQGGSVQTDAADIRSNGDKSTTAKSGDITVTATSGSALFNTYSGYRTQFNATGNIALHANGNLTHWYTQANAGGGLSSTSATGQINGTGAHLVAKDILSFASKGSQSHANGFYSGGTASLYNETGPLALTGTRVQAVGTPTASLAAVSGQTSLESGGTLAVDAGSVLVGTTDLSIIQGQGDIVVNPATWARGTLAWNQIGVNRNLTLATRNGNLTFTGSEGSNGHGSSSNVGLAVKGDLNLIANNITLQGSRLSTGGALNITATAGNLAIDALRVTQAEAGFSNTYWDYASLFGKGIALRAAGDINVNTLWAESSAHLDILAGGNLTAAANVLQWTVDNRGSNGWYQYETYLYRNQFKAATDVSLGALGGHLNLNASDVVASNGTARLQALGSISLEAAQEYKHHLASTTKVSYSWLGFKKKKKTTYYDNEYLTADPVTITGRNIEVKAGNNLNTYATQFNSGGNLSLQAGDAINYYAVYDQASTTTTQKTKSSFAGFSLSKDTTTSSRNTLTGQATQLQSQNDILSQSGGSQLLQGTKVSYGGSASFEAGVGEKARADARIVLEGMKNSVTQTRTREANYVVWQKLANSGSVTETLVLPSFTGPTTPKFSAPGGLSVQLPAGSDFKSQIQTLAAQPGMGYLNALTQRSDVNWQPVKLAYEQWDYKQSGLTPAGAALVAVVVTWAMGPGGAGIIGNATTTAGMMSNAALASLASQAAISFINNKGDVGKTLKELGSSQTVKATIAAALTAGVLEQLGATGTMKELAGKTGFSEKLTYNLINATGRALTNTAINGGNLEDTLKAALIGGIVDTAHGQVASKIGQATLDYVSHKLAHALAGCVAGAAAGGACKDGAIGGAVGEIVAEMFKGKVPAWNAAESEWQAFDAQVKAYGKLVAGAVTAYAGGDAQTAITTAQTAIDNNTRIAFRMQAAQQGMTPMQFYTHVRVQSLQRAIVESGGSVPPNMTEPGARVNYTQADVARLETQLRGLSPQHQLIYSQASSTLSPIPASYVNMRYNVNMDNVVGASGTNAFGFNSGGPAFFRELMRQNPQMFSARNQDLVNLRFDMAKLRIGKYSWGALLAGMFLAGSAGAERVPLSPQDRVTLDQAFRQEIRWTPQLAKSIDGRPVVLARIFHAIA